MPEVTEHVVVIQNEEAYTDQVYAPLLYAFPMPEAAQTFWQAAEVEAERHRQAEGRAITVTRLDPGNHPEPHHEHAHGSGHATSPIHARPPDLTRAVRRMDGLPLLLDPRLSGALAALPGSHGPRMSDDALIRFPTTCPQCGQPAEYLCRPDDRHGVTCCERCGARTPELDEPAPTA